MRSGPIRKIDDAETSSGVSRATLQALVAEARSQQQFGLADRLEKVKSLTKSQPLSRKLTREVPADVEASLVQMRADRRLKDMVLSTDIEEELKEFVDELADIELLRSHGLEPRHKVLLVGPPGTGKTSLAEVLATELKLPFLVVRYDGLIASFLGETASRLRKLTDFISERPCVVFFDEFDTLGKERGDTHETGEIKRVVSSLLLQMDALPSHCVVVCATNHPELLDRAVWRRFDLRLEIPMPGRRELAEWYKRFKRDYGADLQVKEADFVTPLMGLNFSDIESFTLDIRRKIVLSRGKLTPTDAVRAGLERLRVKRQRVEGPDNSRSADSKNSPPRERPKTSKGSKAKISQNTLI